MKSQRYQNYQDSGVPWIGDVPKHWEINRFKISTKSCRNGIWGTEACNNEDDIKCVRVADFDRERLVVCSEIPTVRNVNATERLNRSLKRGDLLLEKSGGGELQPVGAVVLYASDEPAICSNFIAKIELVDDMEPSFWRYCHAAAYSVRLNYRSIKQTSGIQNLDQSQYLNEYAPFPPVPEQRAIAAFLDAETSKIDALVAEQRRLIELLKEKRQAVISHAVTKGLNPHVKMKPSGIDWLGDVPEHWEIARLGRCGILQNGLSIDGEAFGSGFPFISYSDVYQNEILPELPRGLVRTTEKDQERYDVAVGDVFFTRTSETVDDIGVASTCLASIPRATFAGFLIRFRPTSNTLWPNYSTYLFRNEGVKRHFAGTMNLVTRASLSQGVLKALPICIPPRDEQRDIARYLDDRANALLHLISQAEKAIALLQERRTALISAAVTGKIDVRDFIPKEVST